MMLSAVTLIASTAPFRSGTMLALCAIAAIAAMILGGDSGFDGDGDGGD